MRRAAPAALALLLSALAACTSDAGSSGASASVGPERSTGPTGATASPSPATDASTLRVMEFNVEYGGNEVDFAGVPLAIEAAGADVVAIEEGYGNMPAIAASVGWEYFDPRTQVMSRYPLLTPPGDPPFVYVEVAPGRVVAIANVHLPSTSYGPFKIRDGASADEVVAVEEHRRLPVIAPVLTALEKLAAEGVPVFLLGDFNAPSYLDWTEAAVGIRDHVRFAVRWPVSVAVEEAGLVDSYREIHPDPVADQGLTWPANRPIVRGYNPYRNGAPADRIDFVYAGGPVRTLDSALVGEEGGPGVDVPVSPWPTDHRATVSTFEIEPAPAPTLVSVDRRLVTEGEDVAVRFAAAEGAGSVAFVAAGSDPGTDLAEVPVAGETSGAAAAPTDGWERGAYEAVLRSGSGEELARARFWVQPPGGEPEIATGSDAYAPGAADRRRLALHAGEPVGLGRRVPAGRRSPPRPVPAVGPHRRDGGRDRRARSRHAGRLAARAGRVHRLPDARRQLRRARRGRLHGPVGRPSPPKPSHGS